MTRLTSVTANPGPACVPQIGAEQRHGCLASLRDERGWTGARLILLHFILMLAKARSRSAAPGATLPLAAVFAVLEGCPTPALVVDPRGRVLAANACVR